MSVDWKARLIETTRTRAPAALSDAVAEVVADVVSEGAASLAEVKRFLADRRDVFGDQGEQAAKKAAETLLALDGHSAAARLRADATSPKGAPSTAVKPHELRMTSQTAWHAKVQLPTPPITLTGAGKDVVVDGERFSAADLAALLAQAA